MTHSLPGMKSAFFITTLSCTLTFLIGFSDSTPSDIDLLDDAMPFVIAAGAASAAARIAALALAERGDDMVGNLVLSRVDLISMGSIER